ncbi:MAG: hypothetical protein VYC34_02365 [Planctomycetota bacterium]|nr:hypothetical protein [Planctomycetota bacterium]
MSPSFSPVFGRFDADIRLSSTAPAFEIATFEPLTGFVNCRILADQGTLRIRGGATLGSFGFGQSLPAIGEYSAGEAFRLGIEALPSGTLRIYLNDSLAFEGEELNSVNFNAPGRMGRWGIWQGTRSGTVPPGNPDGTGSTITIDNVVVAPSPCQMDFSGNGMIDAADLALLLNFWGDCYDRYAPCPADFDHDNKVNIADISYMLASWGPCD